jgi:hypothetical protein
VSDELPDIVLIELGRFTWAAILLEDLTDSLCGFIHYANPREDRRSIGQKIKDARRKLGTWNRSPDIDAIDSWLIRAAEALERRNALLHSVPMVLMDSEGRSVGHALGEMPRSGSDYFERHLTVDGVRQVRYELQIARNGWRETVLLADQHHP